MSALNRMSVADAELSGVHAYRDGRPMAPALNKSFIESLRGSHIIIKLLEGYIHGWTIASLALSPGTLAGAPSLAELARIENRGSDDE